MAIEYLVNKGISNEAGAAIRASSAQRLFAERKLLEGALEYIAYEAQRATATQKERALAILKTLGSN